MKLFQYVLITDGRTDRVLKPIIDWLLNLYLDNGEWTVQRIWANPDDIPKRPARPAERLSWDIHWAIRSYPCELLFIHRDAENQERQLRLNEIQQAVETATMSPSQTRPFVCVIPVRMTEAWLLIDEKAIRAAVGNRAGKAKLNMPSMKDLERIHAKDRLHELLITAYEGNKRNREKFNSTEAVYFIPDYITDFAPLRQLSAFAALESDLQERITAQGWNNPN
jgi:Domain of unknown function (DUF4276)